MCIITGGKRTCGEDERIRVEGSRFCKTGYNHAISMITGGKRTCGEGTKTFMFWAGSMSDPSRPKDETILGGSAPRFKGKA